MGGIAVLLSTGAAIAACSDQMAHPAGVGMLSGQVVVSGPLRRAAISVDHVDFYAKSKLTIESHVGSTTTDDDGRFALDDVGAANGFMLITARGGSFEDIASGSVVQLDPTTALESITELDLLEHRDDVLVSPVGHLIVARTREKMMELGSDITTGLQEADTHLSRHFAGAPWMRLQLASLNVPATSPTEAVRAALVHAALSFLAHDIAEAAGASPQEVNVLTLTQQLAADLSQGQFDGNDGDAVGGGLQLGVCPAVAGCTSQPGVCPDPCRTLCDIWSGTTRALLAGETTKVIQSPALNHTGLVTGDILAVARSMANSVDPDLFGATSCISSLDRIPPRIDFVSPTPAELDYKRGSFMVKVVATDDTDPMPRAQIVGSDESVGTATATIDSTRMPDGMLQIDAMARDMSGNVAMTHRTIRVDNTAPRLTLDPTPGSFLVDGGTWWTTVSTPTLQGSVNDAAPVAVATTIPGGTANATVTGSTWTAGVATALDPGGTDVVVAATDAAGNRSQVSQRIRPDVTPPELMFQQSVVNDEALEVPTFDANEIPVHVHTGASIDLSVAASCPTVTRFSYLLAQNVPYGREVDDSGGQHRNPLHYVVHSADDGVGIASGSTQYRVGYRSGNATTWLLDWTTVGTPVPNSSDVYDVKLYSDQIPQLASTEGVYMVDFRTTDRLSRTTTATRCFDLHLRAAPLHFVATAAPHVYRLDALTLPSGPFHLVASRLLNDNATGASLIDKDVSNGTGETVFLEIAVTKPASVKLQQAFVLRNFIQTLGGGGSCLVDDGGDPANCLPPVAAPVFISDIDHPYTTTETSLNFPAKVFELNATGAPTTEVPCLVCGVPEAGTARLLWKFAIPPRTGTALTPQPPRRFKAMTMMGQASGLWPMDGAHPASPPFVDAALGGRAITGGSGVISVGCSRVFFDTDGTPLSCLEIQRITPYRALSLAHADSGPVRTQYRTAPTQQLSPVPAIDEEVLQSFTWTTTATTLP